MKSNVFVLNESVPMVQSVKEVLDSDGYLVQVLTPGHLPEIPHLPTDALASIRTVRQSLPRMSQIVLVPVMHS